MKPDRGANRWMSGGAAVLLLGAVLWSVWLLSGESEFRRQTDQQAALAQQLASLQQDAAALEAYRLPFAGFGVVDPEAEGRRVFAGTGSPTIRVETAALLETLRLHTVTVDYAHVDYAVLVERIRVAEAARPPLKLTGCVFEAAPGKTGGGQARLTFELAEWR